MVECSHDGHCNNALICSNSCSGITLFYQNVLSHNVFSISLINSFITPISNKTLVSGSFNYNLPSGSYVQFMYIGYKWILSKNRYNDYTYDGCLLKRL